MAISFFSIFKIWGKNNIKQAISRILSGVMFMLALIKYLGRGLVICFSGLVRNWHTVVQTLSVLATAVFTYFLYVVTADYTKFTKQIFESQHEKYIYDVVGQHAFQVVIRPSGPVRSFNKPQLRVYLKNLTALEFARPVVQVFARIRDKETGNTITVFAFDKFIGETLGPGGDIFLSDDQNDLAYNLKPYLSDTNILKSRFDLIKFSARVEALSPGGVLWRLKDDIEN